MRDVIILIVIITSIALIADHTINRIGKTQCIRGSELMFDELGDMYTSGKKAEARHKVYIKCSSYN